MFRAELVIPSSRGDFPKGKSTKSQSYGQSKCHIGGLKGDFPSDCPVRVEQLVGGYGKVSCSHPIREDEWKILLLLSGFW